MAGRSAGTIAREISEKIMKRNELMNAAKEMVIRELSKLDTLTYELNEEERAIYVEGTQYGKAVLDLNQWFGQVRDADPAEYLARDMMEDIKNQLLPDRDYSM